MLNWNKFLLISLLIMSTLISVSANSWLSLWMGLEINLMAFIPLIIENNNMFMSEAMISYFLIQTLTSINFLFFIFLMKFYPYLSEFIKFMINMSLLMKMGAAPFHFWFPKVMSGLSWLNCLILSTWQKITPMMALSLCLMDFTVIISIILSSLIGALGGLNQTSIRTLMSFSSINHLSWMLLSLMMSLNMWLMYFTIYFLLNCLIMYMFNLYNFFYLNQLFNFKIKLSIYYSFLINLLSLGGLPPFLGFFPKWLIVYFSSFNNMNFIIIIMMMTTLITLSFYINITLSALIINYSKINWFKNYINLNYLNLIFMSSSISMFGLIFISILNFSF